MKALPPPPPFWVFKTDFTKTSNQVHLVPRVLFNPVLGEMEREREGSLSMGGERTWECGRDKKGRDGGGRQVQKGKQITPQGGGGTPIHYLYGYVPPNFRGVF